MSIATRTLGVFAKQPVPGTVKTRLAAASSPAWAAEVAAAFLHDTLDRLAMIDARRVLVFAPPDARAYFAELACDRFELAPQCGGSLGARMAAFFHEQLCAHAGPVVLVGTDSPTLPTHYVDLAFAALEHADVALGPAADGGYYLIGCRRTVPPIFDGIAWGGPRVLLDTIAHLPESFSLAMLPLWHDVDTLADWFALRGYLAAQRRAGLDPNVLHTERLPFPPVLPAAP